MTHKYAYPIVIVKGCDLLQVASEPGGDLGFIGLRNGRIAARGADKSIVLRMLIEST